MTQLNTEIKRHILLSDDRLRQLLETKAITAVVPKHDTLVFIHGTQALCSLPMVEHLTSTGHCFKTNPDGSVVCGVNLRRASIPLLEKFRAAGFIADRSDDNDATPTSNPGLKYNSKGELMLGMVEIALKYAITQYTVDCVAAISALPYDLLDTVGNTASFHNSGKLTYQDFVERGEAFNLPGWLCEDVLNDYLNGRTFASINKTQKADQQTSMAVGQPNVLELIQRNAVTRVEATENPDIVSLLISASQLTDLQYHQLSIVPNMHPISTDGGVVLAVPMDINNFDLATVKSLAAIDLIDYRHIALASQDDKWFIEKRDNGKLIVYIPTSQEKVNTISSLYVSKDLNS